MPLQMIITAANTVSRARPTFRAGAEHHRHDQRDFDDGHGDREHERAERFADAVRDDFGVMDRGEHGAGERGREHRDDEAFGRHGARQREDEPCGERSPEGPARQLIGRNRHERFPMRAAARHAPSRVDEARPGDAPNDDDEAQRMTARNRAASGLPRGGEGCGRAEARRWMKRVDAIGYR
jgi:hypothetical protein